MAICHQLLTLIIFTFLLDCYYICLLLSSLFTIIIINTPFFSHFNNFHSFYQLFMSYSQVYFIALTGYCLVSPSSLFNCCSIHCSIVVPFIVPLLFHSLFHCCSIHCSIFVTLIVQLLSKINFWTQRASPSKMAME